jgi:hypothetical protein
MVPPVSVMALKDVGLEGDRYADAQIRLDLTIR